MNNCNLPAEICHDRFDKIEDKMDKILDKIGAIDVTLARQNISLEEHVKRSTNLEEHLEITKTEVNARLEALEKPVEARKMIFNWIVKYGSIITVIAGTIGLIKLFFK